MLLTVLDVNKGSEVPLVAVYFIYSRILLVVFVQYLVSSALGICLLTSAEMRRSVCACCSLLQYRLWPAGGVAEVSFKRKKSNIKKEAVVFSAVFFFTLHT